MAPALCRWTSQPPWASLAQTFVSDLRGSGASAAATESGKSIPKAAVETLKLLKRLGLPELQKGQRPSQMIGKIKVALTKRMQEIDKIRLGLLGIQDSAIAKKKLGSMRLSCLHVAVHRSEDGAQGRGALQ